MAYTADSQHGDIESKYQETTIPAVSGPVIANPGPLGLFAFALSIFLLSIQEAGIGVPADGSYNIVVCVAFFYGGVGQILAGMWEFRTGNTFGATCFTSYGGFWLSFGLMYMPGSNIMTSYQDPNVLNRSIGFYLLAWTIFTALLMIAAHRSSIGVILVFFMLFMTLVILTAAKFSGSLTTQIVGGGFGFATSLIAWYLALSGLLTKESSYFSLPVGVLS